MSTDETSQKSRHLQLNLCKILNLEEEEDYKKIKTDNLTQIGSSAHADNEREKNDFYATPQSAVVNFLNCYLYRDKEVLDKNLWECSCGDGAISKILENNGYNVFSSDLIDRGYGEQSDFMTYQENVGGGDIITNPPFKLILPFLEHAIKLLENGNKLIFLMRLLCLEGKQRNEFFKKYPIKYVYIHTTRIACTLPDVQTKPASAIAYAWYVWEKGYEGETVIRWLP